MTLPSLRTTLRINAAFSALTGVGALVLALRPGDAPGDPLGLPTAVLVVLGVGLLAYADLLVLATRQERVDPRHAMAAIIADVAWVATAAVVLVGVPDVLSATGRWTLVLLTVVVADLATTQWLGLRRDVPTRVAVASGQRS